MAPGDVQIKFLTDYSVNDGTDDPVKYKEGKKYTMNEASAAHFIRRGVAEETNPAAKKAKGPTVQPVPDGEGKKAPPAP